MRSCSYIAVVLLLGMLCLVPGLARAEAVLPEQVVLDRLRTLADAEYAYFVQHEGYAALEVLLTAGLLEPVALANIAAGAWACDIAVSADGRQFVITVEDSAGQGWSIDRSGVVREAAASATVLLAQFAAVEHALQELAQAEAAYFAGIGKYATLDALAEAGQLEPGFVQAKLAGGIVLSVELSSNGLYFIAEARPAAGAAPRIDANGCRWNAKPDVTLAQDLELRLAAATVLAATNTTAPVADQGDPATMDNTAQQPVLVVFETTKGEMVLEVHPEWSPIGAQRFLDLVKAGFYDGAPWFRVIDRFVAQCGISADPAMNTEWDGKTIKDDPVVHGNLPGCLAFGKTSEPHSRSTHIYINLVDNSSRLDYMGFSAFAKVSLGMDVAQKLARCEYDDQYGLAQPGGLDKFKQKFPQADYILRAYVQ